MSSSATVYLKIPQKVLLTEPQANLGQLGTVWCEDKALAARCMALRICSFQEGISELRAESLIEVTKKIQQMAPGTQVQNLGETEFLLVYEPEKKSKIAGVIKTAGIVIVLFCGAAFSILTFNQDVDVSKVLDTLYELVTGNMPVGTTWMEIGYAIGLPLGILGFYNHFSKKKKLGDPTPLQVQMRQYEKNVNQTVLENDSRRKGDSA